MRIIGNVEHENEARKFCHYLKVHGIDSDVEVFFEPVHGHMSYQIWIHDEDRLEEAKIYLQKFEERPDSKEYEIVEETPVIALVQPTYRFGTHLTVFFLALCSFVFFLTILQQSAAGKEALPPIQQAFLYDLPTSSTWWQGLYNLFVAKIEGQSVTAEPLFVKIREGQLWRLFTPALLHYDLLHIGFNMLWLWALGRPMEQRMGPSRLLLFILACGIFSNTVQYLMSGPFFLGFSGVIAGMAGFIWMREKNAPWEGYPVAKSTLIFLLVFVLAILGLQVASFLLQVVSGKVFAPQIANAAHIAGALCGLLLGRLSFFAQRRAS